MYENCVKKENDNCIFLAGLQGIDLKKEIDKKTSKKSNDRAITAKTSNANALPVFGAPEDYEHLSDEERQELTRKMMGKHKSWVKKGTPGTIN